MWAGFAIRLLSHSQATEATLPPDRRSVRRRPRSRLPATHPRELVLERQLEDDGIAVSREPEPRSGGDLEPAPQPPVHHREDVVLLLLRRIDVPDLADPAVELDAGDHVRGEPIVAAGGVVELDRTPFLADRRQLEGGIEIDRETAEVTRQDGTELELELRLRIVRHLGLEVPSEVDRVATLLPQGAAPAEADAGVLGRLVTRPLQVEVRRQVDHVGQPVVVLDAGPEEVVAAWLLALLLLFAGVTAIGDEGREVLDLVQTLPFGRRRVDLELEEVERPGRRGAQRTGDGDCKNEGHSPHSAPSC